MRLTLKIGDLEIAVEPPEKTWEDIIRAGSENAARKIADALDRVKSERVLERDEQRLRQLIRDVYDL